METISEFCFVFEVQEEIQSTLTKITGVAAQTLASSNMKSSWHRLPIFIPNLSHAPIVGQGTSPSTSQQQPPLPALALPPSLMPPFSFPPAEKARLAAGAGASLCLCNKSSSTAPAFRMNTTSYSFVRLPRLNLILIREVSAVKAHISLNV